MACRSELALDHELPSPVPEAAGFTYLIVCPKAAVEPVIITIKIIQKTG
jgi:hypothetical protein